MCARLRMLLIVCCIGMGCTAEAQTSGLQVGFAVVTVVSGNSAGILPSETLVFTDFGITTQTELTPPALLTNSAVVVNLGTTAEGSTGISVMNSTLATGHVNLSITDAQGIAILNQTLSI